jgi:TRAP-type C4-dicarboxylate transport system permease large subunit
MRTKQHADRRRIGAAGLAGGTLAGTLLLAFFPAGMPFCLFRLLFHVPCPGCGMTRSLISFWRADWLLSLRYHPLGIPIFMLCIYLLVISFFHRPLAHTSHTVPRFLRLLQHPGIARTLLGLILGLWGVRLALFYTGNRLFLW